jgi:hypothetical protein
MGTMVAFASLAALVVVGGVCWALALIDASDTDTNNIALIIFM